MSKANSIPVIQASPTEKKKLLDHLPKLSGHKIMIVGDVGVDEYVLGEVRRISPEAPVPVLEVEKEETRLGLAANVAQNVRSLGGTPVLVSVVGDDSGSESLFKLLQRSEISTENFVKDRERPTTRKTRVMAKHHHLVRVDFETRKFISEQTEKAILAQVSAQLSQVNAIIIEDYAKGLVSENLLKQITVLARKAGKPVMVDPHRTNRGEFYSGVDLIKPNFDEAVALSGLNYDELRDHPNKVVEVGQALMKKTGAKELVMTRGKDGMMIFSGDAITSVPTYARQVFDVTGAGDTVIAALGLGLVSGLSLTQACMLANFAAGVVVGQVGCVPCSIPELREYIESIED